MTSNIRALSASRSGPTVPGEAARRIPSTGATELCVQTIRLRIVEDLREASRGADLRVVQLTAGSLDGQLTHARIGGLSLSTGDFAPSVRARGVMNAGLVTLGMMIESGGEVMQWDYEVLPGDVVVFPRAVEQEGRFTGPSRYVTLTLTEAELAAQAGGERLLEDPAFWTRNRHFRPSAAVRAFVRAELYGKVAALREGLVPDGSMAVAYLKRSLLEAFLVAMLDDQTQAQDDQPQGPGHRLVRAVEDYVDAVRAEEPMHISELCLALRTSRRTLHRAFHRTLGVGPVEYLRLRRLAAVHQTLVSEYSTPCSVTRAALDAGFADLGRFAAYYRGIYGETPSQTQRRASRGGLPAH